MFDRKDRAFRAVEDAYGPLHWHHSRLAEATVGGHTVWFESASANNTADQTLAIAVPLSKNYPIKLDCYSREGMTYLGNEELRTAAPDFDDAILLAGRPAEVVQAAFDRDLRDFVLSLGQWPAFAIDGGRIIHRKSMPTESEEAMLGRQPVTVEYLRHVVPRLLYASDRFSDAFERHYAGLAESHGEAAARAWIGDLERRAADGVKRQRTKRLVIYGIAFGVFALALCVPLGLLLLALLGGGEVTISN